MTTEAAPLRPIARSDSWRGLAGLAGAEIRRWLPWRSLVLAAVGVGVLAVVFAIWWLAGSANEVNFRLGTLMYPFFVFWSIVLTLVVAAAAQGAVAGEVEDGTASWLIGMPIGRPAFIVSKVLGAVPGILVAVFGAGLAAYPVLSFAAGIKIDDFTTLDVFQAVDGSIATEGFARMPASAEYFGMLMRVSVFLIVLVALMVLLGAFFRTQGLVLGLGVALAVGLFVVGLLDVPGVTDASPAGLISGLLAAAQAEPAPLTGSVVVSLVWIVGLTALAVARFRRREL